MKEILFSEMKPFLRFSRQLINEVKTMSDKLVCYDSRMFYCTRGRGEIEIDGEYYLVEPDTLIFWRAGNEYKYIPDSENPMQFYAFNFDFTYEFGNIITPVPPSEKDSFEKENITDNTHFRDVTIFNKPIVIENAIKFKENFKKINKEFSDKKLNYHLRCSGFMIELLCDIVLIFNDGNADNGADVVDEIIGFLKDNISTSFSNKEIGKLFGYHPNYINSLFVKKTGESLHKYSQSMRLLYALQLLSETGLSVGEIANMCGFDDIAHFSKMFKCYTGHSPKVYKQKPKS